MAIGYPANWNEIAQKVKDESDWICEHCGHPHDPTSGHCLTVHHLDMDPVNCDASNLVALCQKCHLHIQARYSPGQQLLPGIDIPAWMTKRGLA